MGHATGLFSGPEGSFLYEGEHESFFTKLEEAIVSEPENNIKNGKKDEFSYNYLEFNSMIYNFRAPSHKYDINFCYLQNLKILLGDKYNLIYENMHANSYEEKVKLYEQAVSTIQKNLSEEQLKTLKDSLNCFILNYSYSGRDLTTTEEQYNKLYSRAQNGELKGKEKEFFEHFDEIGNKIFPLNYKYAKKNGLLNKSVLEGIDDICELSLDVINERMDDKEYDEFQSIIEACKYSKNR